MGNQGSTG